GRPRRPRRRRPARGRGGGVAAGPGRRHRHRLTAGPRRGARGRLAAMQPTWGTEAEQYREKVQAFLAEHLPADWKGIGALPRDEVHDWTQRWRQTLADNNLLAPRWPAEYGGPGLTETETVVLAEEFAKAGVPTGGPNDAFSIQMV